MYHVDVLVKKLAGLERHFSLDVAFEVGFFGDQAVVSLQGIGNAVSVVLWNYSIWSESPYKTAGRAFQAMSGQHRHESFLAWRQPRELLRVTPKFQR